MAEKAKDVVQANGYSGRVHVHHTNVGMLALGEQVRWWCLVGGDGWCLL
jgi:hypothetical protein